LGLKFDLEMPFAQSSLVITRHELASVTIEVMALPSLDGVCYVGTVQPVCCDSVPLKDTLKGQQSEMRCHMM